MAAATPGTANYDALGAALAGYQNNQQNGGAYLEWAHGVEQEYVDFSNALGLNGQAQWNKIADIALNPRWSMEQKSLLIDRRLNGAGGPPGPGGGAGSRGGASPGQIADTYRAEAQNMGGSFGLEGIDWSGLAAEAGANNWSVEQLRDRVVSLITMDTAKHAGLIKTVIDKARQDGADYFMDISDEDALAWAKRVASNELDGDGITSEIRDRAGQRFNYLKPAIDSGVTLKQYFAPHREEISKLLEISPEAVDFTHDMRWWNVLRVNQLDGTARAMDVTETGKFVRGLDEWKHTSNAKTQVAAATTALAKTFGALG